MKTDGISSKLNTKSEMQSPVKNMELSDLVW